MFYIFLCSDSIADAESSSYYWIYENNFVPLIALRPWLVILMIIS